MNTALMPANILTAIQRAQTPEESHKLESVAQAARAYYKEQQDYESMTKAVEAYYLARRKTTELILPFIKPGRPNNGDGDVTILADFGITKKQWSRRCHEYEINQEKANEYFDECISKGWNPSIAGVVKYSDGKHNSLDVDFFPIDCKSLYNKANDLVTDYRARLTAHQLAVLAMVVDAFKPQEPEARRRAIQGEQPPVLFAEDGV